MNQTIEKIYLHCAAFPYGNRALINGWHLHRGWRMIGYHFLVLNGYPMPVERWKHATYIPDQDGLIEIGRPLDDDKFLEPAEIGAHVYGKNRNSIAICMIGDRTFTWKQLIATRNLICGLQNKYNIKIENVIGHYESDPKKTCPNINMEGFRIIVSHANYKNFILGVKFTLESGVLTLKDTETGVIYEPPTG